MISDYVEKGNSLSGQIPSDIVLLDTLVNVELVTFLFLFAFFVLF